MIGMCSAVTVGEQGEVFIFVCKGRTCRVCVRRLRYVSRERYRATSAVTRASVFVIFSHLHDVRQTGITDQYYRGVHKMFMAEETNNDVSISISHLI